MSGFQSPNHTQVPNDFFDMIPTMSSAELRVTLIMIRETRGWHRDAAKVGKKEMADRTGLSYNGVTAGCEAAEKRGTFRRTNPDAKTKAEWELITEDEPSASEGVSDDNPQVVRDEPSAKEGQVRLKKVKEINTTTAIDETALIFQLHFQTIGIVGNFQTAQEIGEYADLPALWIEYAYKQAADANVRNWRYVRAILENCKTANGIPQKPSKKNSNGYHPKKTTAEVFDVIDQTLGLK